MFPRSGTDSNPVRLDSLSELFTPSEHTIGARAPDAQATSVPLVLTVFMPWEFRGAESCPSFHVGKHRVIAQLRSIHAKPAPGGGSRSSYLKTVWSWIAAWDR